MRPDTGLSGSFLPVVPFRRAFRQSVFSVQVGFGEHVHGQRAVVFSGLVEPVERLLITIRIIHRHVTLLLPDGPYA